MTNNMQPDTLWTASIFSIGAGITFGSVLVTLMGFVVIGVVQPFFRVFWTKYLDNKFPKKKKRSRKKR